MGWASRLRADLQIKRDATVSGDPVEDLRAGWDAHLAFATAHPAIYQLVYSPAFAAVPAGAGQALVLLRVVLERCARAGRLRMAPDVAAQTVLAANVGVCLSPVTQPTAYADPGLAHRVRDAVFAAVLTPDAAAVDDESALRPSVESAPVEELRRHAVSFAAQLRGAPSRALTVEEAALLQQWLARLSGVG